MVGLISTKRIRKPSGVDYIGMILIPSPCSYEPDWQNVFWGAKYDRLLSIKERIDPTNLFVCNRCVGTDIVLEP